jgi:acyl dehydratase
MSARDLTLDDIAQGDSVHTTHIITDEIVESFANITKDHSPLHMDEDYAASTPYLKRVVHGMLIASLCSELVGMQLPGKRALILSQRAQFLAPTYRGDTVTATGTVTHVSTAARTITLALTVTRSNELLMRGEVTVLIR